MDDATRDMIEAGGRDEKPRESDQQWWECRPWRDHLPEAVRNLLDINSMFAYWDKSYNGGTGWRIMRNSTALVPGGIGYFVREGAPLGEWIVAVEVARTW